MKVVLEMFNNGIWRPASACVEEKLTTKSSTESELVGVAVYLPKASHLRLFIETQGFLLRRNVILHDN